MTAEDQQFIDAWNSTDTGSDSYGDGLKPSAGWLGELNIVAAKFAEKDGKKYIVVDYKSADGMYEWSDFKYLTTAGQMNSAKILLKSLGYPNVDGSTIGAVIAALPGKRYTAEMVQSSSLDRNGVPYVNTQIIGEVSAAVAQQAPPAVAAANPGAAFPPAPATIAWDQPAADAVPAAA